MINIFLCGDVMTGRGIDQILPYPANPTIHEPYARDARDYVNLAEQLNGQIKKPVDFSYIWGDALEVFDNKKPDAKIINLETSITGSEDYINKGINYRMNPENIPAIQAARIDICTLANNHTLDWGYEGLLETLTTLKKAGIKSIGAGQNLREAEKPAIIEINKKGRVVVFSFGHESSGIPPDWAASEDKPGIALLGDLSDQSAGHIKNLINSVKQPRDIIIVSIHWGGNWGYEISRSQIKFAHKLIDSAGADIVHGHSSHHVKGINVYKGKLILYGCGDFLNDYEGIVGYEQFRGDLGLMYFASVEQSSARLIKLTMAPTQIKNFRVNYASRNDTLWLKDVLNREGNQFGTSVRLNENNTLTLHW